MGKIYRIISLVLLWPAFVFSQSYNILLIVSDDLNTRIEPYEQIAANTPHLSELSERGVTFTRAYCQYPLCGPSRASLMSGLYPETNTLMGNSYDLGSYRKVNPVLANHPSMAGIFREQGYYTARVSKIFHMGVPGGIERGEAGGDDPDSWDYAANILGPETLSDGAMELLSPGNLHYGSNFSKMVLDNDKEVTQTDYLAASQAIAILESRAAKVADGARNAIKVKPDAPFFLGVGLVRPHVPLIAPEHCFSAHTLDNIELPKISVDDNVPSEALRTENNKDTWDMDQRQQRETIQAYLASIRFMDQQVGRLLEAVDRLGLRQNTIIIFISDHGYLLGEHGCWSKSSLWEGGVRVPMIISHPDFQAQHGKAYDQIVELIDLYPTLVDLGGLSNHMPSILQGRSLAPVVNSDVVLDSKPAYTISYQGRGATLRSDRWRYTHWQVEASDRFHEELYDHLNDPLEQNNLVGDPEYENALKHMQMEMEAKRKSVQE